MPDVFLSYSRRDSDFVRDLVADLEGRGKSVWVDTDGIADAEVFPDAIRSAIEGSDAFVFVITPESAASAYCEQEVEHALALNKRVVPVLREAVADDGLPEAIRVRNWIPYTADVDASAASERLVAALDTDLAYVHAHTRWLVKALEWDAKGRDKSFLLRGSELASAEAWLAGAVADAEPAPTALQREYLLAGRTASARRQRILVGASLTGLVLALILAGFALLSRNQAQSARSSAQSRALAAQSATQLTLEPERALLLAMDAVRTDKTPEATYALRRAIDLSPIRGRLPGLGVGDASVAYSPDGKQIAEASKPFDAKSPNAVLVLTDARTLKVQQRIDLGVEPPIQYSSRAVAYSPDGSLLAVGTGKGVLLLDPRTGKLLSTIGAMALAYSLDFSPDGWLLAAAQHDVDTYDAQVQVWDIRTHSLRVIPTGPIGLVPGTTQHRIGSVGFSPDGRRLVVGGLGMGVLDLKSGRPLATAYGNGENLGRGAEYSPDGSMVLVAVAPPQAGSELQFRVELLDAQTLKLRETVFSTTDSWNWVRSAHFSQDGQRVVYTAGHEFGVYSLKTHSIVYRSGLGTANLPASALSPDDRRVAVTSGDGGGAVYRAGGVEHVVIDAGPNHSSIGRIPLALTRDRVIATFSPSTGPNNGLEVVQSWSWNGRPTAPPLLLARHNNLPWFGIDPQGQMAFTVGSEDESQLTNPQYSRPLPVRIWDIGQRRVVKRLGTTPAGAGYVMPPVDRDGARLVVQVSRSRSVGGLDLVDVAGGRATRLKGPCDHFGGSAISADGSAVAAVTTCPGLFTWRITPAGAVFHRLPVRVVKEAEALMFSPDAKQIAIANMLGNGDVGIVDSASGKTLATLAGHTDRINNLTYSPDGMLIATASVDGTVRVWDPATGRLLRILDHPAPVLGVAFSPDSRTLATNDTSGVVRLWDACSDCRNPDALMALAKSRVTRELTPSEKRTYLG